MSLNDFARHSTTWVFRHTPEIARRLTTGLVGRMTYVHPKKLAYLKLGCPSVVLGGVFEGMKYLDRATSSALMPKLVGTYESELVPTLQQLKAAKINTVVDIGAAEGYYAIGLLKFLNASRCICFDTDPKARRMLSQMANLNHVDDQLDIRSECSPSVLNAIIDDVAMSPCLIICDVDGAELQVIDPIASPRLADCFLIIETHDAVPPGPIVVTLTQLLSATHRVEPIWTQERVSTDLDERVRRCLDGRMTLAVMDEHRPRPQIWLIASPKNWSGPASVSTPRDTSTL
jgi:predicted O-methyltransferase YrrM